MTTPIPYDDLHDWCVTTAEGFRRHEHTLDLTPEQHRDRDATIVEFTLRLLTASEDEATARLVERIDRVRAMAGVS